jgi:flagellin-like protein
MTNAGIRPAFCIKSEHWAYRKRVHNLNDRLPADFRLAVKFLRRGGRKGVSEIVASMLLIALTLVAGFALFGFVRGQASASELSYAQSVGGTNQYLSERFTVTLLAFTSSAVSIYLYTNGQVPSQIAQVEVYGPTRLSMDIVYDANHVTVSNPPSCAGQSAASSSNESPMLGTGAGSFLDKVNFPGIVTLTLPSCSGLSFQAGNTYFVKVLGQYGNTASYYQAM